MGAGRRLVGVVIRQQEPACPRVPKTDPEELTIRDISNFVLSLAARIMEEMPDEEYDELAATGREYGQQTPQAEVTGVFRLTELAQPTWIVAYHLAGIMMPLVVYWQDGQLHESRQEEMK